MKEEKQKKNKNWILIVLLLFLSDVIYEFYVRKWQMRL